MFRCKRPITRSSDYASLIEPTALKQAAVQGLGVILVPKEFVSSELADGPLVTLLPDWQPDPHALFAVYPFHKEQSRNVRLFIEFLVKAFQPR